MEIKLFPGGVTESKCECIVNAANTNLAAGSGVCGAIFKAAGLIELQHECDKIGFCPTGNAVITGGYNLCKYIIHAVGPVYHGVESNIYLYDAYYNALKVATLNNIKSIAFPSISTGVYGFPLKWAAPIAFDAITMFFKKYPESSIELVEIYAFTPETYDAFDRVLNKNK